MWIGIDPSYTRTGLVYVTEESISYASISKPGGVYEITQGLDNAHFIASEFVKSVPKGCDLKIGLEYPIMASRSGSVLSVLMAKFDSAFRCLAKTCSVKVYFIPSVAIPSFTGIRITDKAALTKFTKEKFSIDKKINHDEASAHLIYHIARLAEEGKYRKTFYFKDYSSET